MPITKEKDYIDQDALSDALMAAGNSDKKFSSEYGYRQNDIDALEDEIIKMANSPDLRLCNNPSLLECIAVQNAGQAMLNRLTEIELEAIRIETKLGSVREVMTNNILNVLGTSGSAESRKARATSAMMAVNHLLALEGGLLRICETARKNIASAINGASRAQTALQTEIQFLDGAEIAKELQQQARKVNWK